MKYVFYFLIPTLFMGLFSCDDFLDVAPKGKFIPENTIDYDRILNGIVTIFPADMEYLADDLAQTFDSLDNTFRKKLYLWEDNLDPDIASPPFIWTSYYSLIYSNNVVINEVLESKGGAEDQKKSIYAEALVNRADLYFQLMSYYSTIYNPTTAATDWGIPLVTGIDITEPTPPRSTVTEGMNTIINDIKIAIPSLPTNNINKIRVNKYAAYGLLSRIYLTLYQYDEALNYANLALEANHQVLDYNGFSSVSELPEATASTEQLWVRYAGNESPGSDSYLSDDLISYFDSTDMRSNLFLVENKYYQIFPYSPNTGISFPEIYLTKAECLARKGQLTEALTVLNEFRKKRVVTASYHDLTAGNKEEAIVLVLAERRRELFCKGITRWMDMRRLSHDGRMKEVVRKNTDGNVIATLPPGSPKYALRIPVRIITFNPDMPNNRY